MLPNVGLPADYGLPEKFVAFRKAQTLGIHRLLQEELGEAVKPRFRGVQMPVGSGKTGYFMALDAIRRMNKPDMRTAIITITKPLQQQILREFKELGIVDIRGRSNYACQHFKNCEEGGEGGCAFAQRPDVCEYFNQYTTALGGRIVLTNLSYWLAIHKYGKGLGKFDLLIVDEAHSLLGALTDSTSTLWPPSQGPAGFSRGDMTQWIDWAEEEYATIEAQFNSLSCPKYLRERGRKLAILRAAKDGQFVVDVDVRRGWARVNEVWPADSAEENLFLNIPEVVLLSGTLLEKTMEFVGAHTRDERSRFETYGLEFPADTWPIKLVDVGFIQYNMSPAVRMSWVQAHASIVGHHKDLPGIIHPVSYDRSREIAEFLPTPHKPRIVTHKQGGLEDAINRYTLALERGDPAILISPAVTAGYDFPQSAENFAIVSKMPRGDTSDTKKLQAARNLRDSSYADYEMMMAFGQSIGRAKRNEEQVSRIYVLDSHAWHLLPKHGGVLVPEWVDGLLVWGRKNVRDPLARAA